MAKNKNPYEIRDRETGTFIDEFPTKKQAYKELSLYEKQDKKEGVYEKDFYEVYEKEENPKRVFVPNEHNWDELSRKNSKKKSSINYLK